MSLTSPKRSGCSREPVPMTSAGTKPLAVGWTISEGRGHQGGEEVRFLGTRRHVTEGFDVPRDKPWHMICASQVERSTCEPFAEGWRIGKYGRAIIAKDGPRKIWPGPQSRRMAGRKKWPGPKTAKKGDGDIW